MEGEIEYYLKNVYSSASFNIDIQNPAYVEEYSYCTLFYNKMNVVPFMQWPNSVINFSSGTRSVLEGQRNIANNI
jgi:hypothetical protein